MQPAGEHLVCVKCNFETHEFLDDCPRCGQVLRTARQMRGSGWVLAVLGAFLVVLMTGLIIVIASIMANSDDPDATTRFNGSPAQATMVFGILGLVWMFGLTALAGGIWQIKYGRRNTRLMQIVILLGLAFLVIGMIAEAFA